jgi:hypothetical protein
MLKKTFLIGCTSIFAYWTLRIYLNRRKFRHIPGPPTKGILGFYFGNMTEVLAGLRNDELFNDIVLKW